VKDKDWTLARPESVPTPARGNQKKEEGLKEAEQKARQKKKNLLVAYCL